MAYPRTCRGSGGFTVYDEFAGAGGSSQGAVAAPGTELIQAANHNPDALQTHGTNFPEADHILGDVTKEDITRFARADIFLSSPACFTAGTLILTRRGLTPVEDVQIGDEVFTHRRRWRPVVSTMQRTAPTVRVAGVGMPGGVETTAEHPFYTRRRVRVWDNAVRRWDRTISDTPEWTEAKDIQDGAHGDAGGHMWATPIDFGERLPVPAIPGRAITRDADFWWAVGRWLGDGWLRIRPRGEGRYEVSICCGHHEAADLSKRLTALGLRWWRRDMRTAVRFTASHQGLAEWLAAHFGQHAHGKTIPAWALTMPGTDRAALLDGYLSADGHTGHYTECSTVSKRLAVGLRMLAGTLGHAANVKGPYQRAAGRVIEGRIVDERPTYAVAWITGGPRHAFHRDADGHRWTAVHPATKTGRAAEVFNISVAEDESYTADGIVVHNCPPWTDARGKKRDFDKQTTQTLPGMPEDPNKADEKTMRARKLMEEIPRYLRHWVLRGKPVLAGVVENVVQCRKWIEWNRWLGEIRALGYKIRIIAFNSMHAVAPNSPVAPQSRDRLYVAYWRENLPEPDWDKWLRPRAWCPGCDEHVYAMQVFKKPGVDMGRYGPQYVYRCPRHSCRGRTLEPAVMPAFQIIDWNDPGVRIGDREAMGMKKLEPATIARIRAGLRRYAVPLLAPAGGTWRDNATPVTHPMPTRTTRECDGIAVPPLMVPVEGRPGKTAVPATRPVRTQTRRNETGVAWYPFITPMRGGGDKERARGIDGPIHTVTAGGNHHGLTMPQPMIDVPAMIVRQNSARGDAGYLSTPVTEPVRTLTTAGHQSLVQWEHMLVPYNGKGVARPISEPMGVQPTRDRWALASYPADDGLDSLTDAERAEVQAAIDAVDIDDVYFRMLGWEEIKRGMAFHEDYVICGSSNRVRVQQLGNAVTPPVMELIVSALVEALSGESLPTAYDLAA